MKSIAQKKKRLKKSRLYAILDKDICLNYKNILRIGKAISRAEVDIIQLRDKSAKIRDFIIAGNKLQRMTNKNKTLFIINDRPDAALACNADGVHIGQDDITPRIARRILGKDKIIGLSCTNLDQVKKAQENPDVDYICIGPIFPTSVKPDSKPTGLELISNSRRATTKPLFVIGGIDLENIESVMKRGADGISVCRAICQADDIKKKIRLLKQKLNPS